MVNGASPGPAPAAQARASSSRLTRSSWRTMAPPEAAQERPQGGWRIDYAAERASRPASAQHVGVVNAVGPSQRRRYQGHNLVSCVRPTRGTSQVNVVVDEFTQTQVLGEGDRKEQSSIGHYYYNDSLSGRVIFANNLNLTTYCHEPTAIAQFWPHTKGQAPYLAIRRCNTMRRSSKAIWMWSGWLRGSIY